VPAVKADAARRCSCQLQPDRVGVIDAGVTGSPTFKVDDVSRVKRAFDFSASGLSVSTTCARRPSTTASELLTDDLLRSRRKSEGCWSSLPKMHATAPDSLGLVRPFVEIDPDASATDHALTGQHHRASRNGGLPKPEAEASRKARKQAKAEASPDDFRLCRRHVPTSSSTTSVLAPKIVKRVRHHRGASGSSATSMPAPTT
jgi:hypothetical protein